MKEKIKYVCNVLFGISILAFCIFALLAILTYNELDTALSSVNTTGVIFNKCGKIGAYFSDFCINVFGTVTYFLIALFAFWGICKVKTKLNNDGSVEMDDKKYSIYLKVIMFVLFIMSLCGFFGKLLSMFDGIKINGGGTGTFLTSITAPINPILLLSSYFVLIILSTNFLTDFDYRKFYKCCGAILSVMYKVLKFIIVWTFRILRKFLILLLPNKLINSIKTKWHSIFHKKDDQLQQNNDIIDRQNKKIALLQQYIEKSRNTDKLKEFENEYKVDLLKPIKKETVLQNNGGKYKIPPLNLLASSNGKVVTEGNAELKEQAIELTKVLEDYKIHGKVLRVKAGPIITLHEFEPVAGIKSSRIISSADDIARNLKVKSARISIIPERNVVGIELPNKVRNTIYLKDVLQSEEYQNTKYALPIVLGVDIAGSPVIVDLAKCPHLLVAGTTGSGKSVSINTMILSLLYRYTPDECKFIMIDPKVLELSVYQNIPHLLLPVVTESKKAVMSLKWVVAEMENRYRTMSSVNVKNIYGYNEKVREALASGKKLQKENLVGYDQKTGEAIYETQKLETKIMPYIVVVVDEMADLMLTTGKEVESLVQRIAQMARAAGIHIIMSTQRPSTDIITGVIKANFPSRISFLVSSKIDSRVIIGEPGAEQLLGFGDMLYSINGSKVNRAHGPFISDKEVENVVNFILKQGIKPSYINIIGENDEDNNDTSANADNIDISILGKKTSEDEKLYQEAVEIVRRDRKVSISYIQRCLRIGYNKAATIVERMEKEGLITPATGTGKRDIIE